MIPGTSPISTEEKRALGRRGAAMLREGQFVFLDGGATNAELARAIPRDLKLTIATHSPAIAAELEYHAAEVILIGGRIYKHSMVAGGAMAMEMISRLEPDVFFLGVTALDRVRGALTGDAEEAAIKRLVASVSKKVWVLATAEKFSAASPCKVIGVVDVDGLIVPAGLDEAKWGPYREMNVEVIEAA